ERRRAAPRIADARGGGFPPGLRRRIEADFDGIVRTVVGAFKLGDGVAAGYSASGLDGEHHSLGTRVDETYLLELQRARPDLAGKLDFMHGGNTKGSSLVENLVQGTHDRREGVTMDQREEVVGTVEKATPVQVSDPRSRAAGCEGRMRCEIRRQPHAAAGCY